MKKNRKKYRDVYRYLELALGRKPTPEEILAEYGIKNIGYQFSLSELLSLEIFPYRNPRTVRNLIREKKLKAIVFGKENNTRYIIEMKSIFRYLDTYGA